MFADCDTTILQLSKSESCRFHSLADQSKYLASLRFFSCFDEQRACKRTLFVVPKALKLLVKVSRISLGMVVHNLW